MVLPLIEPAEIWQAVADDRELLASWAEGWPAATWAAATPCEQWTVREVVGHLTSMAAVSKRRTLTTYLRFGADWDRTSGVLVAGELDDRNDQQMVDALRSAASSRHAPPGLRCTGVLAELVTHLIDLSAAVGEPVELSEPHLVTTLAYLQRRTVRNTRWNLTSHGRVPLLDGARRSAGLLLRATDAGWTHDPTRPWDRRDVPQAVRGTVQGTAGALIAALAGRHIDSGTVVGALTGDGVDQLLSAC